ncbi:hypothetical protein OEZ17_17475 [Enterococcus avium]|uniref:hypothetical protein n=1 Tax=Enterococcus avium TaxID=33945 RepID=UPI0025B094E2|nr:hypothetical protein [Enterococcus avium]MDN2639294.1 hypothetical protein [Enterococcus avium]
MNKQEKEKFIEKILSWGSWCNEVHTGELDIYVKISKVRELIKCVNEPQKVKARLAKHWDEDLGDCLWWNFPVEEPPYCGTPLDDDFPKYKTHFTELHIPDEVEEEPKWVVKINNMYFLNWGEDGTCPTFVIDDAPGTKEQAEKYESEPEAKSVAEIFGGTVEKV